MMLHSICSLLSFFLASTLGLTPPPQGLIPSWSTAACNASLPLGGFSRLPNAVHTQLFNGSLSTGAYNHAPMLGYDGVRLFAAWKNDLMDEDSPGERIVFSQSLDGVTWVPSVGDPPATLFPNMSTNAQPAALFVGPPLYVGGRMYAAASPRQFCLYPAPDFSAGILLLRRVYPGALGSLGPIFWSTPTIPKGFELASQLNGITTVRGQDAGVQADVALLTNASAYGPGFMPCAAASPQGGGSSGGGGGTLKCEACAGGCQPWEEAPSAIIYERTHFTLDPQDPRTGYPQVLLWRANSATNNTLWASVKASPSDPWSAVVPTNIPNQPANFNAGALPARGGTPGRRFLALNPCPSRDPLVLATSLDGGLHWDRALAVATCGDLAPHGAACRRRNPGRYTGTGLAYPQVLVLDDPTLPPALQGLWMVWSANKEDIYVTRADLI